MDVQRRDYFALTATMIDQRAGPNERDYFIGITEAAFRRDDVAKTRLNAFLDHAPNHQAREMRALRTLAAIGFRDQDYAAASQAERRLIDGFRVAMTDEEIAEAEQDFALAQILRRVEPMRTISLAASAIATNRDEAGYIRLPARINDALVSAALDPASSFSLITTSAARSAGLRFLPGETVIHAEAGAQINARVALASSVSVGRLTLASVVFLVLNDADVSPQSANYEMPPLLGFPVVDAMEHIELAPGQLAFAPTQGQQRQAPNLALDGFDLIVDTSVNGARAPLVLDLSAEQSALSMEMEERLPGFSRALRTESDTGGVDLLVAPEIRMRAGGHSIVLRNIPVGSTPEPDGPLGRMGRDFWGHRRLILDLRAMRMRVVE